MLLAGLALCCYSLTLLVCQLASARFATAAAGVVLLALFLTNSLSRTIDALKAWRWLSPFHYYEQSRPLAPGGVFDVRATEVLFGIAVVAALAAALAFAFRDLGSPLVRPPVRARRPSHHASGVPFWRLPIVRGLYDAKAEDLVMISDVDEIPRAHAVQSFTGTSGAFEETYYYYKINCENASPDES